MKKLFLSLLLAPLLLFSQPSFTVTDSNGLIWDSQVWLDQGVTIVIQFYSPSPTCWPSSQSIENFTNAYYEYSKCNDILFLQVAEWGSTATVIGFLNDFGRMEIPTIIGYDEGNDLTIEFTEWGLQWAYELWLLRPDGSYEFDIPYAWNLDNPPLNNILENEGFSSCENNIGLEDYEIKNNNETIYDLQGRILNEIPKSGFYIKGGKKYCVIK
jgi:hypothetical protein